MSTDNAIKAIGIMAVRSLSHEEQTLLSLANHYRYADIFSVFYKDLSSKAKQILSDYTQHELKEILNNNSYSEMTRFTSLTQALIVFHGVCIERGYGIPIEACIALIGCLELDVNEAIHAPALNTIH